MAAFSRKQRENGGLRRDCAPVSRFRNSPDQIPGGCRSLGACRFVRPLPGFCPGRPGPDSLRISNRRELRIITNMYERCGDFRPLEVVEDRRSI
jgi:hypothetical protein